MAGHETYQVPATDVPAEHQFQGGLLNTGIFRNLSTTATAYVVITFQDGAEFRLYAGETLTIEAADTSTQSNTGKVFGSKYDIRGDGVNAQDIWVFYTTKAPFANTEQVTV